MAKKTTKSEPVVKESLTTEIEKKEETPASSSKKTIRMIKVVCRPEGTFLPNRVYEVDSKFADRLISSNVAKEEK